MNVMSDVVQSVPTPHTVPALEQLLRRDVDLLVYPAVIFVLRHVVTLLAGDPLLLLDFVTPRPAVEVHLPDITAAEGAVRTGLHLLPPAMAGGLVGSHLSVVETFEVALIALQLHKLFLLEIFLDKKENMKIGHLFLGVSINFVIFLIEPIVVIFPLGCETFKDKLGAECQVIHRVVLQDLLGLQ